jgi:predicted ATP-grasp superfamily ATP-dependent carboligase
VQDRLLSFRPENQRSCKLPFHGATLLCGIEGLRPAPFAVQTTNSAAEARLLELQYRIERLEKQRDQLRELLRSLLRELEQQRSITRERRTSSIRLESSEGER